MKAYIIRRLLLIIPTLFILSVLVFLSVRFIPGDIVDTMVASNLSPMFGVDREVVLHALGLDVPVYVQYGRWLRGIFLHGTLGNSLLGARTVEERILGRLPVTLELGFLAILIALLIALPVGIYSAIRQDTVADYVGRSIAIIGLATPNFWLALMVMIYPAIWWGWAPPMRLVPFTEDPLGNLEVFLIPSLILGTAMAAATMRMTRTMMPRGAQAGLYQDRLVQGTQGEGSYYETRHQECPHPGSVPDRPAVAYPGRWRRYHGEHIQPAGLRSSPADCTQ